MTWGHQMSTLVARFYWVRKDTGVTGMARFLLHTSLFCHIDVLVKQTPEKRLIKWRVQIQGSLWRPSVTNHHQHVSARVDPTLEWLSTCNQTSANLFHVFLSLPRRLWYVFKSLKGHCCVLPGLTPLWHWVTKYLVCNLAYRALG